MAVAEPPVSERRAQRQVEPELLRVRAPLADAEVLEQPARKALRPQGQRAVPARARVGAL